MPRKARIDAPGALQHIIIRGIERKAISKDNFDRENFLDRLSAIVSESKTGCYGWAIMTNHVHMLLKTGLASVATAMRSAFGGCDVRPHKPSFHIIYGNTPRSPFPIPN